MRSIGLWLVAALTLWSAGAGGAATTHYVVPPGTPGGKDAPPFNAWTNAATNIQAALNAAVSGDVVLVTNAWYPLAAELIVTQAVDLRSWNAGALDPAGTALDGQAARRCVYLNRALMAGFTISNGTGVGTASSNIGGAVLMAGGTLSNCVVAGSSANTDGGGIYVSAGVVVACRIEGNIQTNPANTGVNGGGGVELASGATLRQCTVAWNTAETRTSYRGGGGVYGSTAPDITDCLIVSNRAYVAGGGMTIFAYNGKTIRDCTLAANSVTGATYGGGGLGLFRPAIGGVISNCHLIGNSANSGGGILFMLDSNPYGLVLSNCVVDMNSATSSGAGLQSATSTTNYAHDFRCYGTSFSRNRVTGTGATCAGGGLYVRFIGLALDRCTIRSNIAHCKAGATFEDANATMPYALRNCLVADNVATGANTGVGGLYLANRGWLDSCTIVSNRSASAAGIGGISLAAGASATNTIVYHNSASVYPDWTAGAGAVIAYGCVSTSSPAVCVECTTETPALADLNTGDYRLTANSPCVNRGTNEQWMDGATDLDGRPRLDRFGRRADIGAYEFMPAGILLLSR